MKTIILIEDSDKSAFYRGTIIQTAIMVEYKMDLIIGRFISSNVDEKIFDVMEIFDNVESIGFNAKSSAIQYIIKKTFPDFLKEHNGFLSDLDYLIRTRNIVAHKRPQLKNIDYSVLSWSKALKNSVDTKSFLINIETCNEYKDVSHKIYTLLIKLDNLVIESMKQAE